MSDSLSSAAQLNSVTRSMWTSDAEAPAAGQIWRARWQTAGLLVVLIEISRSHVLAVPVTADPAAAGRHAVRLARTDTTVAVELFIWPGLQRLLPVRVLDRRLGDVTSRDHIPALATATSQGPDTGHDVFDPALEERARLEDEMAALADAAWAPTGSGRIKELLDIASVSPAAIRQLPGVKPAEALAIRRGERPLTSAQIAALVELTGTPATTWWAANPQLPADLIDEVDQPAMRRPILALAAEDGSDELEQRCRVAYAVYALAARQTGAPVGIDWAGRLRQYLAAHGQG